MGNGLHSADRMSSTVFPFMETIEILYSNRRDRQNLSLMMNRNLLIFLFNLFIDNLYTSILVPVLFSSQIFSVSWLMERNYITLRFNLTKQTSKALLLLFL